MTCGSAALNIGPNVTKRNVRLNVPLGSDSRAFRCHRLVYRQAAGDCVRGTVPQVHPLASEDVLSSIAPNEWTMDRGRKRSRLPLAVKRYGARSLRWNAGRERHDSEGCAGVGNEVLVILVQ